MRGAFDRACPWAVRILRSLRLRRGVVVEGRIGWSGACADRLSGQADWTLRLTLLDARIGRARLGEPLELHARCAPARLHGLLSALVPDARVTARIEFDRGARMRARLGGFLRIEPPRPQPD
ncbi:MAG: hypothetical protein ACOY37_02615 [Pseudomonadota bacterium]